MVVLQSISFANYALTTTTTNIIYGSAPYLTFDGGRTRITNTEALLGISLSDGRRFTPTTNNSSYRNPIELPVAGQSFVDIGMLVPTDTDSIALSLLIGTPYNYWGDDDGDGQGVNGVTATGSLSLSIFNRWYGPVSRNEVLNICDAPYQLTLSNDGGTLKTRYGVPNESRFNAGNVTYRIKPKASPTVCFARPHLFNYELSYTGFWTPEGARTLSFMPSSYGSNFPTTGAHNLYFDLKIFGTNQVLSWAPVSHGGITATMTYPYGGMNIYDLLQVTLTGPAVTDRNQWESENPGRIARPSLPQVFELVGRDSSGNAVLKYGFVLKQWFVNRGSYKSNLSSLSSWCNKIGGYRVPNVRDLTNASCRALSSEVACNGLVEATPSSPSNRYMRAVGAGLSSEWGVMYDYTGTNFAGGSFWTQDRRGGSSQKYFVVDARYASLSLVDNNNMYGSGVCVYP